MGSRYTVDLSGLRSVASELEGWRHQSPRPSALYVTSSLVKLLENSTKLQRSHSHHANQPKKYVSGILSSA